MAHQDVMLNPYVLMPPLLIYNSTTGEITYESSSIRYKKNVIDLSSDTSSIYNLRAREFDTIEDEKHLIGWIAEECYKTNPLFAWKKDGLIEGVDTHNILVFAVEEIKKHETMIQNIQKHLSERDEVISQLTEQIHSLKLQLQNLTQ